MGGLSTYVLQRAGALIPSLLAIATLTFFMGLLAPGDPISMMLGERAEEALVAQVRYQYGLDQPLLVQYSRYLAQLLQGELGLSYFYVGRPVAGMVMAGFWTTLKIGALAAVLGFSLGIGLGVVAAAFRQRWPDTLSMFFAVLGISLPSFVLAAALMYVFAVRLRLLPAQGWGEAEHYVLPVLILGIRAAAYIARITRSSLLDALGQDFIRTGRAKGLAPRAVVMKHALKNALIPVLTVLGTALGGLLTGSFIVEYMLSVPGLGRVAVDSILQRDYPVIQAATLLIAMVFALVSLAVDLLYAVVDPRIRYR